ncbi:hypothetical protein [Chitinophaga flava]|uniref:Uncharacterized protein n=1 Tax=Chitinophaga flava TaxID=2259036 RepID=A0A365Y4R4_9BACT|nr:hypothetical protein [Chitinophaga flava]RBL93573.1 hypothetical protein DF182_13765 [Chitinophaga flava]
MAIMIGTIFTGSIHQYKNQGIRTKFFIIGLPLFPVSSYYKISANEGIALPLNGKSIWHGYSRTTFLAMGIVGLLFARELPIPLLILAFAAFFNGLYSWALYTILPKEEEATRYYFSRAFDYNILPELLPQNIQLALFQELLQVYRQQIDSLMDWEQMITQGHINENNKYLLYTAAYYHHVVTGEQKYHSMQETFKPLTLENHG